MHKLKFVFIVNDYNFAISHRAEILEEMHKRGFDVNIVCFPSKKPFKPNDKFKIHIINSESTSQNIFQLIKLLFQYFDLIKKLKPNIVHLVTIKPVLFGGIVMLFFRKVPVVFSIPGFGSLFSETSFISKIKEYILKALYKTVLLKKRKNVIVQSKQNLDTIFSISKIDKKQVSLIPGSGVDLSNFSYSPIKQRKTFIFASRLLIQKGVEDFFEASRILKEKDPEIRMLLAGNLDLSNPNSISEKFFNSIIKSNFIEYLGELESIKSVLEDSTCLVLPTYYGEGLPKVLIEANAIGRPVIATKISGCSDFIIENKNGFFIQPKNPEDIAEKIIRIANNEKKQDEMALFSSIYVKKNHDVNQVVSLHVKLYEKALYEEL
tara:strand:+ start:69 stop:1202 length:1134 start_codon:yes stop_codon:yes gene_type:complete